MIQQGLVASIGAAAGIFVTALFFALGHGAGLSPQAWGALVAQTLLMGIAFGYARHAPARCSSPILLHVGVNGMGVAAMAAPHGDRGAGLQRAGRAHADAGPAAVAALGGGGSLVAVEGDRAGDSGGAAWWTRAIRTRTDGRDGRP